MRVLLATPTYSPFVSGSARLLQDIVEHLLANGHHVEVLTLNYAALGDTKEFDLSQSYRIHRASSWRIKGGSSVAMMSRMFMLCARRKFDIVLCGFGYPTPILACLVCAITAVPFAVHALGEDLIAARHGPVRRALSIALRKACVVVCISRFTANEAELLGVSRDKLLTISPGIDPVPYFDVSIEDVEALRSRLGLF